MALWLVRAGKHGEQEELAVEQGFAVIGWPELPDLAKIESKDELKALMERTYPEAKSKSVINYLSQVWAFRSRIEMGDVVALPLKHRPAVALGIVKGPYRHVASHPEGAQHARPVEWVKTIPRAEFDSDLLFSLGAFMTVCQITRNDAEARIRRMMGTLLAQARTRQPTAPEPVEEGEERIDLEGAARETIRQHIARKFKGHELTRLVAAILEAEGYKTYVSPPGSDRGADIVAGKGSLGFDAPRLIVEVKSGDEAADSEMITKLHGAMRRLHAHHGLFVSWGGFKRSTDERELFFEIRLWNGDVLIERLLESYDRLPQDIQAEIPLKRIWTLLPED